MMVSFGFLGDMATMISPRLMQSKRTGKYDRNTRSTVVFGLNVGCMEMPSTLATVPNVSIIVCPMATPNNTFFAWFRILIFNSSELHTVKFSREIEGAYFGSRYLISINHVLAVLNVIIKCLLHYHEIYYNHKSYKDKEHGVLWSWITLKIFFFIN